jgi:hypothetical protein
MCMCVVLYHNNVSFLSDHAGSSEFVFDYKIISLSTANI